MKRIISLLTAVIMCISMLPAVQVFAAADKNVTYYLSAGEENTIEKDTDLWRITDFTNSTFHYFGADEEIKQVISGTALDGWTGTAADAQGRLLRVRDSFFRFVTNYDGMEFSDGRWFALKLDAGKLSESKYNLQFDINKGTKKYSVWLAPYITGQDDASSYMTDSYSLGSITFTGETSVTIENIVVDPSAEYYILIIKQNKSEELRLTSFTFVSLSDEEQEESQKDYTDYEHSKTEPIEYNTVLSAFNTDKVTLSGDMIKDLSQVTWDNQNFDNTAPWKLDYTDIASWAPTNTERVAADYMRIDFNNSEYYENGYSAESTASDVAPYFVLRIYVPNKGKYNISLSGTSTSNGGVADVYLDKAEKDFYGPADITDLKDNAELLGCYDTKDPGLNAVNKVFEKGEYVFLFVPNEKSKDSVAASARNYLSKITLTPILSIGSVSLSLSETEIKTGAYIDSAIKTFDANGAECSYENAEITYSTDNDGKKYIHIDEITGEIYAKRPGTAKVTVTVKDEIATVSDTAELTVTERFAASELPGKIIASLPLGEAELGVFTHLKVTDENGKVLGDGIEYSYDIEDETVLGEDDGIFIGKKLGKTEVTVTAKLGDKKTETTFTAVVTGENLFTRNGVRHGDFENNVYLSKGDTIKGETTNSAPDTSVTIWSAAKNLDDDIYTYDFLENIVSDITGRKTNVVKATVDETPSESGKTIRVFRIENGTNASRATLLEKGKIYEYSGFVKLENATTVPEIQIRQQFYKASDGTEIEKDIIDQYPFEDVKGAFPWSSFTVGPFYANWEEPVIARSKVQAKGTTAPYGYDFLVSHLAFREVTFESVLFTTDAVFDGAKTYDTFETSVVAMSNTGRPISPGNAEKPLVVEYSSSDPVVAKVDANGVITAVSDGDCEIYADITLGDVTQRGVIPVHLEGLEVKFESIKATATAVMETGDVSKIEIEYFNTDASENSGDGAVCYFMSDNPEIAAVSQEGVITALNPGKTQVTAYVSISGITAKQELEITVTDDSPLVSAYIGGAEKVEVGFTTKLTAGAYHESGAKADMTGNEYSFALENQDDNTVLRVSADGTVEGLSEGTATVVLTVVRRDGEPLIAEQTVEVVQGTVKRKIFDFLIHTTNTSILDATIEKFGWEINRDETSPTRIAEGESGIFGSLRFLAHGIQFKTAGTNSIEGDLAIDLVADYEGWYNISFEGSRTATGCHALAYMNGEYLGECDFSSLYDDVNAPFVVKFNPVYLEKGVNTFKLRADVLGKYFYPRRITLDYIGGEAPVPQSAALSFSETTVPLGSVLVPSVTATMSGAHNHTFGLDFGGVISSSKKYTLSSENPSVVKVTDDGRFEAVGEGTVRITANVIFGDYSFTPYVDITVTPKGFTSVEVSAEKTVMAPNGEGSAISIKAFDNLGDEIPIPQDAEIFLASSDENVVTIDENGYMTPHSEGSAEISVTVTIDGITQDGTLNVSVRHGKIKSTYYTDAKVSAARENISKYTWAKDEMKEAVALADKFLPNLEMIFEYIHSPDIPRGYLVGFFDDPDMFYCRYCGENIYGYSKYPWQADALNRPWKVQCPDCKRLFPSNDFASLYELVTENNHGIYDVELAYELNEKIKRETGGKTDYLKNVLYPEIGDQVTVENGGKAGVNVTVNVGKGLRPGETVEGWGVDDGLGYMPKKPDGTRYTYDNGVPEVHSYVSTFAHIALWDAPSGNASNAVVHAALQSFRDAYVYTGDEKYGRAGVILLDRIADYYPAFDLYEVGYDPELKIKTYQNTGGSGMGKIIGNIWEANNFAEMFAMSYDAFFELYDDPQVVNYLNDKAEKLNLYELATDEDAKFDKYDRLADKFVLNESGEPVITSETLRQNVESGILKEILPAVKKMQIAGNFGFKQDTMAKAAVILDTQPYTQEIIDFIMAPGETDDGVCTGGNVMPQIINIVDRDGVGNESSQGYNMIWAQNLLEMAQVLNNYEDVELEDDLLANPKYVKMLQIQYTMPLVSGRTPNIGDAGSALSASMGFDSSLYIAALDAVDKWDASDEFKEEKRRLFSQALYYSGGNSTDELHYDIFTKEPESLKKEVEKYIDEYGEYDFSQSYVRSGYGIAALNDGVNFMGKTLPSNIDNTTRDFFIYFGGGNTSHHHYDGLNLGMDAYGIDMAPDLGYPAVTGGRSNHVRTEWVAGTVSHNTVVVNDDRQRRTDYAGQPLHFDDSGEVKVMDISMPEVYGKYVDTYRRTVVSVDVDDTVSYGIDFFRIIGGDEHVYSFHSRAFEAELDERIKTVKQPIGTYAGADVPYGDVAYSESSDSGYNWLDNVSRAVNPQTGIFNIDFDIEKISKVQVTEQDWHLRLTMLNDFNLSEIALADGYAPQYGSNPETPFKYVLARRSGKNLNTLFATVLEPYVGQSNIKSLTRVPVTKNGKAVKESEGVAAVKVTLNNGRVDYVVYATDNTVTYRVDDLFDFAGFVGVYTVSEEDTENYVRAYLLDGTNIGDVSETSAITGRVTDFTQNLAFENYVEIELDEAVPENTDLVGRLLDIENDGQQNGTYTITSAEVSGNTLKLGVGDVTFIRSFVDSFDTSKGYYYNIEEGQNARIALSSYHTSAPDIEPVENQTVSAGSTIKIPITATSDYGRDITYVGTTLPRGMSINQQTGTLTWKPDASQVGDNHVAITADDGILTSTVRFTVTVYGSTTSKPSDTTDNTESSTLDNSGTAGGGGGGGGGSTPTDKPDDETKTDETDNNETSDNTETGETAPEVSGETDDIRFTDISDHVWAADAINALATAGIIKGTTATTYSPASNITRADFALLLVRAFGLNSDNTENFADVSASDYFASELAIARNTGIVSGIGDNKFAPRNSITRQDMMVIVYRALQSLGNEPPLPKGSEAERNVGAEMNDSPVDYQNRDVTEPGETGTVEDGGGIFPSQYTDFSTVAPYARNAVSALIGAGLVNGKNGNIASTDYTTRAEVAVLIKRILDYIKS